LDELSPRGDSIRATFDSKVTKMGAEEKKRRRPIASEPNNQLCTALAYSVESIKYYNSLHHPFSHRGRTTGACIKFQCPP
jgi:hypothetical protein